MAGRDVRAAVIAAAVGLALVLLLGGIGLIQRANMPTSGGGGPRDGDTISIPVGPEAPRAGCMDALLAGLFVPHPEWGVAVGVGPGEPQLTLWPHGYTGRIAGDRIELVDSDGQVVARTGGNIEAGGGLTTVDRDEGFGVCPGSITVEAAPPRGASGPQARSTHA